MLRILKASCLVGTVAKWLVRRMAAAAQTDGGAPREAEGLARHVRDFEISFDAQRSVIPNDNLCRCHSSSVSRFLGLVAT